MEHVRLARMVLEHAAEGGFGRGSLGTGCSRRWGGIGRGKPACVRIDGKTAPHGAPRKSHSTCAVRCKRCARDVVRGRRAAKLPRCRVPCRLTRRPAKPAGTGAKYGRV